MGSTSTEVCTSSSQETEEERSLRTRVFVQGAFHWSVSIIGYCVFFVIGAVAIPHIFSPVKVCIHSIFGPFKLSAAPTAAASFAPPAVTIACAVCWRFMAG